MARGLVSAAGWGEVKRCGRTFAPDHGSLWRGFFSLWGLIPPHQIQRFKRAGTSMSNQSPLPSAPTGAVGQAGGAGVPISEAHVSLTGLPVVCSHRQVRKTVFQGSHLKTEPLNDGGERAAGTK